MKSKAIRVAALAFAGATVAFGGYALAADVVVSMTPTGPQPATITVDLGDTVTWTNAGTVNYGIAAGRLGITSPAVAPTGTFSHVMTDSGTFPYLQQGDDKSRFDGSVVVRRTGEVTLSSPKESVGYGSSVVLSGKTTLPAYPVTVDYKPEGERSWLLAGTLTPAPDGSFAIPAKPSIFTSYRARVLENELISKTIGLRVTPKVSIRSSARRIPGERVVTLTARVVPASAARTVEFMRYDREHLVWRRLSTRPLSEAGIGTYRWKVPFGRTLVRGWLKGKNLRSGFVESYSVQILIQGTGTPPEQAKKTTSTSTSSQNESKQKPKRKPRDR